MSSIIFADCIPLPPHSFTKLPNAVPHSDLVPAVYNALLDKDRQVLKKALWRSWISHEVRGKIEKE